MPSINCIFPFASTNKVTLDTSKEWMERSVQKVKNGIQKVKDLSSKIYTFYLRYQTTILLYSGMALIMSLFPSETMRTLLPGLGWGLTFTQGTPLPRDFTTKISFSRSQTPSFWIPNTDSEAVSNSLKRRYDIYQKASQVLSQPAPLGWVLLEGESRVGKSQMLSALARKMAHQGHPVYRLEPTLLQSGATLTGALDSRFLALVAELKVAGVQAGKTPILVIDEIQSMLNVSHPGFNDCLKIGPRGSLGFNILAATNQPDTVQGRDEALYRRFHAFYTLEPLDQEGVIKTLSESKRGQFESKTGVQISDELIRFTVSEVYKQVGENKAIVADKVSRLLLSASFCAKHAAKNVLSKDDIQTQMDLLVLDSNQKVN